jgi:hypothetical protein
MTDRVTWDEVGRRFTELGRAVKAHAPGPGATPGASGTSGTSGDDAGTGPDAASGTGSPGVDDALAQVTDALNRLSVTVSEAVDDPAVRDAARTAMHGVGAALNLTFDEIADAINRAAGTAHRGSRADTPPEAGDDEPVP